jgi:hypothetical protein
LDTRYSFNVLILTVISFGIGMATYILLALLFKVEEAGYFVQVIKKFVVRRTIPGIPVKEQEPVSPTTGDTQGQ